MMERNDFYDRKISKLSKETIELYLKLWNYNGVVYGEQDEYVKALQTITGDEKVIDSKNCMIVCSQDENNIDDLCKNTYGIKQLLYELEVMADIPTEIIEKVKSNNWFCFIARFIKIYEGLGYKVIFAKQTPLAEYICTWEKKNHDWENQIKCDNKYEKIMIIDNGNGGRIKKYKEKYKRDKLIKTHRMIVLFRSYIMELLCDYFKHILGERKVDLYTVNWIWALDHMLWPAQNETSYDLECREMYSLSQIVGREKQYSKFLEDIYAENANLEYIRDVMDIPSRLKLGPGYIQHEDHYGANLNVVRGIRKTTNQISDNTNTIYLMGGCVFFGYAEEDSHTIASQLQYMLNKQMPQKKWKVVNYGTWGGDIDWTYKQIYNIDFKPGDVVFVSYAGLMPLGHNWGERDISISLKDVHADKEFYFNNILHCNVLGYKKVAERMFQLFSSRFLQEKEVSSVTFRLEDKENENSMISKQVDEYVGMVKKELPELKDLNVGSIVMNCNPFTLGHQYLIEYAAKQVDVLIIFVVEENRSTFPFEDRIKLVQKGTSHMENVYVVPSGKMIISTATFPGYFLKDNPEKVELDASFDVSIFGKYICPRLNIKKRFVGEEPFDIVTYNYNQTMRMMLPMHGVDVVVVPRKKGYDGVISASKVRKYLELKEMEKVKEMVPVPTYEYLKKWMEKQNNK